MAIQCSQCFLHCWNASWNALCDGAQFTYRIFLNLPYGLETTSFQSGFKFGKQEKVRKYAGAKSRE